MCTYAGIRGILCFELVLYLVREVMEEVEA